MPLEIGKVDALVLIDGRMDHIAAFNAGKIAQKVCEQKKTCVQSVFESAFKDNETVITYALKQPTTEKRLEALGELAMKTVAINVGIDAPADSALKSMAAGYTASKDLAELEKKISELEAKHKFLDTPLKRLAKIANENEKSRKELIKQCEILQGVETRRKSQDAIRKKYFDSFDPAANSCRGRRGKIMNKPENSYTKANKNCNLILEKNHQCKFALNTNIINEPKNEWEFLHGDNHYVSTFNNQINTETVFIETDNIQKNSSLCHSIINTVVKYRKWILLAVITGIGTYIIFKNRTKIKPFLKRIKKIFQRPVRIYKKIKSSRVFKTYKSIKNSKIINNRFTRPIWFLVKYNIRTSPPLIK